MVIVYYIYIYIYILVFSSVVFLFATLSIPLRSASSFETRVSCVCVSTAHSKGQKARKQSKHPSFGS